MMTEISIMEERNEVLTLKSISSLFTDEILLKAVQKNYKKKNGKDVGKILSFNVKYACGKGDGYMGVVYRIQAILDDGMKVNLIGKGMPANITRRKTFRVESFFANEVYFYNKVVPMFFEILNSGKNSADLLTIPDCYFALSDGENDFLVMEDLFDSGFKNIDRSVGLNIEETKSMFQMLARFHAVSMAAKYKTPEKFDEIAGGLRETLFYRVNGLWTEKYIATLAKFYTGAIEGELKDTEYLQKFKEYTKPVNFYEKLYPNVENRENPCVINHGDSWVTNFMFKGLKIMPIDFQLARYGSPILDLSVVIFACTTSEGRNMMGGLKGLLKFYQTELNSAIKCFGAPEEAGLTFERLYQIWQKFGAYGFCFSLELVQLSLIDGEDVEDLDRFDGEEAVGLEDITPFGEIKSEQGKKRLADLVRLAVDEGLI